MQSSMHTSTQVALIVLDGWGHREDTNHNAIAGAATPFFSFLWADFPHTLLEASGREVGLPEGQMGNSEIGHMTIGAGRVIDTDLVRITKAMRSGEFAGNAAFLALCAHVKKHSATLHIMGLASPGGVHSHHDHLFQLLRFAKSAGIADIAVHVFTDGRDMPPQSAHTHLLELESLLSELGIGRIATLSGRFYAMDRDGNWDRVKKAERALFHGEGVPHKGAPSAFVRAGHAQGAMDEHLEPTVFLDESGKPATIGRNDGVFFFNFRSDRARMISKIIADRARDANIFFATMTQYDRIISSHVAFPPPGAETTLARELSAHGFTQAHIAETEKYAHATYFLNGGVEEPHAGEEFVLIESRKDVPTHDLAPLMRAREIADAAIERIEKGVHFLFINFANADMVGHTANVPALVSAIEEVDRQLARIIAALENRGGVAFITSDHGNAEVNIDHATGERHTAHTSNPVPAICTKKGLQLRKGKTLADIAPTILELFALQKPPSMTGSSLLIR